MLAPRDVAFTTEWRPLAGRAGLAAEWRALARRVVEPNVFYEPDFALAAAPALGRGTGAVLVRAADQQRLIGLFPCRIEPRRYAVRLPLLMGWTHHYAPLGTPLVDAETLPEAVSAFLDHVAEDDALPKLLLMPELVEDGAVAAALAEALARRGGRTAAFGAHRRALLAPGNDRAGYLDAALGRKRRKEIARQRRRLDEAGGLAFALASAPADVAPALEDFFALEARGWKGAAGTAATQTAAIRQFVAGAVVGLAAQGQASVARLIRDGHAIAAGVLLRSGRGAWFWKIAYDERAARASPGVQLTCDLTDAVLRDGDTDWCDSCATPDHTMIDSIWRERRSMTDQLIALTPGLDFTAACRLESLRRSAITAAKHLRELVRR